MLGRSLTETYRRKHIVINDSACFDPVTTDFPVLNIKWKNKAWLAIRGFKEKKTDLTAMNDQLFNDSVLKRVILKQAQNVELFISLY